MALQGAAASLLAGRRAVGGDSGAGGTKRGPRREEAERRREEEARRREGAEQEVARLCAEWTAVTARGRTAVVEHHADPFGIRVVLIDGSAAPTRARC